MLSGSDASKASIAMLISNGESRLGAFQSSINLRLQRVSPHDNIGVFFSIQAAACITHHDDEIAMSKLVVTLF